MSVIQLAADSTTVIINGTVVNDTGAGDRITMTPVNPATSRVVGNNQNVVIAGRVDSQLYDLVINVIKYSDSDVFLNCMLNQHVPVVIDGSIKEDYFKDGEASVSSWSLERGSMTTQPTDTRNDQDGNAILSYTIQVFATRTQ